MAGLPDARRMRTANLHSRSTSATGKSFCIAMPDARSRRSARQWGLKCASFLLTAAQSRESWLSYDYISEQGELLFQVVRFEPKDFRQRRTGRKRRLDMESQRRASRALSAAGGAQGQVRAHLRRREGLLSTARKLGLVATCNAGGAGKWRDEYSECLRGKRIAIIPDADESGRGTPASGSLTGKAESVKVLELPGVKDLSEWVERGGTRETFLDLIGVTPEWRPSATAIPGPGGFNLATLGELLDRPETETEWLWQGCLAAGTVSAVVSKPKVGKSTLARDSSLAVARGETFLGMPTKRGLVVYLALEERAEDVTADFRAMGAIREDQILIHADRAPAAGILAAVDLVRERKPALVVIDPLFRLAHIKDEKAYAETYAALGPLIDEARASGTHVLLTHHSGKSAKGDPIDSPLGSTALGGAVSTLIVLRRTEQYRLIQTVQRLGHDLPETVLEFSADTHMLSLGKSRVDSERADCEADLLEFLKTASEPQTQEQIRDGVEGHKTTVIRAALTALVKAGKVTRSGEGRKGKPFLYEFPNTGSQYIVGTREPESQNDPQTRINGGDKVVPGNEGKSIPVPGAPG